ncbi:MAG: hypothetical protein QG623_410, partial [Patescibacteria group bacterium]|nr:hypothetical protein [Patescibacteria group bacterium]
MAATSTTYKNGRKVKLEKKEDYTLDILRAEGSPPTPSLMIRREAYQKLNGFDESYTRHQDYEFL